MQLEIKTLLTYITYSRKGMGHYLHQQLPSITLDYDANQQKLPTYLYRNPCQLDGANKVFGLKCQY